MSILSKSKCVFYKAWDVLFIYYLDIIFTLYNNYMLFRYYLDNIFT